MITLDSSLFYLLMALGVVLVLWVAGLMLLVFLLRSRLKVVTTQRDRYAQQISGVISLMGQRVGISGGKYQGQFGQVLWAFGDEVGVQIDSKQVTVFRNDIQLITEPNVSKDE